MDSSLLTNIVIVPGVVSVLLLTVFTYLHSQSREPYFRTWQLGWAAYCGSYALLAWNFFGHKTLATVWASKALFLGMAIAIFISIRLVKEARYRVHWSELALAAVGLAWITITLPDAMQHRTVFFSIGRLHVPGEIEIGICLLFTYCAYRFAKLARAFSSTGFRLLSFSLGFWALLLISRQFHDLLESVMGGVGHFLGPLPQMLLGISMVVVLSESERRRAQQNLLALSDLDLDFSEVLAPQEFIPSMQRMLSGLVLLMKTNGAALHVFDHWHRVLSSAQVGMSQQVLDTLRSETSERIFEAMLGPHETSVPVVKRQEDPWTEDSAGLRAAMAQAGAASMTVAPVCTRERSFGVLLIPHKGRRGFGPGQASLLGTLAKQLGTTLEKYALMHDAQRRTKEYELLTQVGQAISSHLDPDEVLLTIHKELGQLFDTRTFYVAFPREDEIHFELEVDEGKVLPKRSRKMTNAFTEHIITTGQPLLIKNDVEGHRARLGLSAPSRRSKCFCGVPIYIHEKVAGVMAAMNYEREGVYDERDMEVLKTAAGQLAVAIENARLFAQEQHRARYLGFLNSVSKTAISSQDAEQMLDEIVGEIQKHFHFDHIGIGLLDYATKDIEIKAEAGSSAQSLGKRIPLGVGILGKVARTNEMALVQAGNDAHILSIMPEAKSVLCVPITYTESLLGVLNIESRRQNAFGEQEVLILRTLADLLATALHNSFVFQKMQQQAITDGLTGIKTRRFFLEALSSEWKRASRSGRPFSVVLIDLDKFKEVNDSMGHLEGDLVLARLGRLLEQKCRQSNVVARYGGDEFVILMPETGVEQAQILSERLRLWIATDPMLNDRHITGSFGVATFPIHGSTVEDIVRVADAGMYVAKRRGGNKVAIAEEFFETAASSDRELVTTYVEEFVRREPGTAGSAEEVVAVLNKLGAASRQGRESETLMQAIRMLTRAVETRELYGAGHGEAVASLAEEVAQELQVPPGELADIVYAARIHDVGKVVIPENILNKPGPLTPQELQVMRAHALVGSQIAGCIPADTRVRDYVRHHHERFDGKGYPDGLKGEEIPLGARIIAVAEAYVNMTVERPYAPARSSPAAIEELQAMSGTQFDGMVLRVFMRQLKGERAARQGS